MARCLKDKMPQIQPLGEACLTYVTITYVRQSINYALQISDHLNENHPRVF